MKILCALPLLLLAACGGDPGPLRVCADPNNLPFSNAAGQGFENRLAELVAAELGRELSYTWWAQRRGMIREALNAGKCDFVPGVASGLEMLRTTRPYYRSTYVAVTRADGGPAIKGFDDPALKEARIGVQMIGDDFANTPPAHALARRGIVGNVRGYMVYGDYGRPDPQSPILADLAAGKLDVAFVWGPLAGWFAPRQKVPLAIHSLGETEERMAFNIAMGTRKEDEALVKSIEQALERRAPEVREILRKAGVPMLPVVSPPVEADKD